MTAAAAIPDTVTALTSGRLDLGEYVEGVLERIDRCEPQLSAFALVDAAGVRSRARELAAAAGRGEPPGPLFGVPVGIKDIIDVRGLPTRAGSAVTDDTPADRDAPAVARLRDAGAIIVGKTRTHEFAYGVTTPPARNPWDLDRIPGGSSGGSGAAVAAGECLAALGTDTGGSVRVPAALCGVSGLRPLPGSVPIEGCVPFSPRLDTCGPLARSAADLSLLYSVLTGRPVPPRAPAHDVRIGVVPDVALGAVEPDVLAAVSAAIAQLRTAGCPVTPVDVPPFEAWGEARTTYVLGDFLNVHRAAGWYPDRRDRYGADVGYYLELAEQITPARRESALERLRVLQAEFEAATSDVDCLLLPTAVMTAPTVEAADLVVDGGLRPIVGQLMRLCGPFSWCGLSAVSIPCGLSPDGLPIGLQLVGRDTDVVLAVARLFQARTDHHLSTPPRFPAPRAAEDRPLVEES